MAVIFRELSRALSFRAALFAAVNVSSSKRKVRRLRYHQLPCQKPIARLPVGVREADGVAMTKACSPFEAIRMDMCPGVWPRLSTVPIPDTTSAPGLIRVVRSVISLKAACVPGIMSRQRSGKEPWLDGGEICHVGARLGVCGSAPQAYRCPAWAFPP